MEPKNIVFFDGVCNLCNGVVNFLIKKDKHRILHYASLQSPISDLLSKEIDFHPNDLDTIYFHDGDQLHERSSAVAKILKLLPYPWRALGILIAYFPVSFRDAIYNIIARNRYKLFGKKEHCRLPSEEEKELFL